MDSDAIQAQTRRVQLRVIEALSYMIVWTVIVLTLVCLAGLFFLNGEQTRDLLSSLKDAWINVLLLVIGYFFGTSASSANKDIKITPPTQPKENP